MSAYVDNGDPIRILHCTAQDFMGERGSVSLAKEDEPEDVRNWISALPLEIYLWNFSGPPLQFNQQSRDRIRYYRTSSP